MKRIFHLALLMCGLAAVPAQAQDAAPPPMPDYQELSPQQMDQLVGPIALYPDPLIAQILPASTLPTQIVLADRYVSGGGDPNQIENQPWDPSVQAVAHYPNVLRWLDDNLSWTTELGQAFINQQQDVMDSIQRLRATAQNLGNLQSTQQQQVDNDDGMIEILPTDPDVMYVPSYSPDVVYYQSAYAGPFITFGVGIPIGGWLNFDFDWHQRHLIAWDHDHPRPANWWHERPAQRDIVMNRQTTIWRPDTHRTVHVENQGDRGWGDRQPVRTVPPVMTAPHPTPPRQEPPRQEPARAPAPVSRTEPMPAPHVEPVSRPAPNNAFIGIQSSRDTRAFSDRGQQSMQEITHSAPVSRPAPSSSGGNGGGRPPAPQQKR